MAPTSFEKRLRVRPEKQYHNCKTCLNRICVNSVLLPDGFVLKKYIAALTIELNILLCKFIEELIQTDTIKLGVIRTNTMKDIVNTV